MNLGLLNYLHAYSVQMEKEITSQEFSQLVNEYGDCKMKLIYYATSDDGKTKYWFAKTYVTAQLFYIAPSDILEDECTVIKHMGADGEDEETDIRGNLESIVKVRTQDVAIPQNEDCYVLYYEDGRLVIWAHLLKVDA